MKKKKNVIKCAKINVSEVLQVMDLYLSDWQHRNAMFWQQNYKFFFAGLIVGLFPYLKIENHILVDEIGKAVFPIIGIILSVCHFIVVNSEVARINALSRKYDKLLKMLPPCMRREKIENSSSVLDRMFSGRMIRVVSVGMPLGIFLLNIIMIHVVCVSN